LVSAMASATSEASSSSSSISEHSESRQVKFAVTSSSSSHCNSNGPAGVGTQSKSKERGGMSKVFQRSCSSAGVLGSLSKQQSFTATSSCKTTTEKDEKHQTGLANIPEDKESADEAAARAKAKRASMVKKALRYFEDKSNRSMSEDNLFTRRKNLAVHLGLDDKVSLREIQKINTYSLPVPSSATPFNATAAASPRDIVVVEEAEEEEEVEEDMKTKDLVRFLGMKDGVTASMASQGRLSEDLGPKLPSSAAHPPPSNTRSSSIGSTPIERIVQKQNSSENKQHS